MVYRFKPGDDFIAVEAVLVSPSLSYKVILALDTGASQSVITPSALAILGFDLSQPTRRCSVITANGQVTVDEFRLASLGALGIDASPMDVLGIDLQNADYEGLLGKDFFRDRVLKIDFRAGTIEVN